MTLNNDQKKRYSRQIVLPGIGEEGQERLLKARVLLIGVGGLGSSAALYLAGAGVGTLGLADHDVVDASNLHRQVLHSTAAVGKSKLDSARMRVTSLNPDVHVLTHETRLTPANVREIVSDYDIVIDGSDNFPTRYLVNDACMFYGKPCIYGAVLQYGGQASVFLPPNGPCYRCLYPEPPEPGVVPTCVEAGVLGVLPGLIGTIQAAEAIKLILGQGSSLAGRLLVCDAMAMTFREIRVRRDPACAACGNRARDGA
ncbi:MAG: molybdopterin-synthase adenylyltransferase MoeB [bacterium]|nr:molybdopterin-synthase adenylyltransferase MoeB [Candidatus Sumerlaeota bacterium]